ncbi:MAG TPA: hypothetical protein VFT22_43150 [Kofleriaceae bacterium]|nr:hypothetical protein [Kofleriaceae bacterium]
MSSTCHTNRVGPEHIMARLKALRDPRLRVLALVSALSEDDPTAWVQVLATIMTRAHLNDDPDAAEVLEVITHAAADPAMPYGTRQRLYEAAARQQLSAIARLFLVASPPAVGSARLAKSLASERPLRPTGRPLTLGERKSLARTHDREQISLMVRDPHPAVVAILLDNPHITEADVVRISSARPALPASLSVIAAHPRWSVRHGVKRALVLNPSTPLADAIRIATTLRAQELRELAADSSLPGPLRTHAAEVYAATIRRPRA